MRLNLKIPKKESGFTLIETMVVAGILAILAGMAIPAFTQWLPNYRLKSAAQDIYSDLQSAKMEAVRVNNTGTVIFDQTNNRYTKADGTTVVNLDEYESEVGFGGGNATLEVDNSTPLGSDFVIYDPTDNQAIFNSRGMCESSGYIYITNSKGTAYAVGCLPSGVILLKKWDDSAGWQ
jgi:prepilin-type N-terminal cleavage/methylation domain-containing protein